MRIVWIFGWVILAASFAFGQGTGTFNGRVVDQGGGVIPGARVTVTAVATGAARSTTTNENGLYSIGVICRRLRSEGRKPRFRHFDKAGLDFGDGHYADDRCAVGSRLDQSGGGSDRRSPAGGDDEVP